MRRAARGLPGVAGRGGGVDLPAGRLFGLQCVKAASDPYPCADSLAASPDGRDLYAVDTGTAGSGTLHVLRFQTRLSRRKRLGRGRYRVTIVARTGRAPLKRRRARFTIVR